MRSMSLKLDSELASIEIAENTAEQFALEAGFDEETASQVALATREAVANAIVHGNQYDRSRYVRANFEITEAALCIQIADQGSGFDLGKVPDPLAPENILRTSGRGIFIMRSTMDEVRFLTLGPGTEINLIKYINQ